jgi:hypothetical protein
MPEDRQAAIMLQVLMLQVLMLQVLVQPHPE